MPYSHSLAERVRTALVRERGITERRMFGGLGFLLRGNICVALWRDGLVVRVGPDAYHEALESPFVAEFDVTGRPMTGWVVVAGDGLDAEQDLRDWINRGLGFVRSLPAKKSK
ncbi:MAG TPA: TfoX/Sxy family protein [Pirellulales bacterium]|nr:TfoX/Sxy family protein [Pirellulales bacterium]